MGRLWLCGRREGGRSEGSENTEFHLPLRVSSSEERIVLFINNDTVNIGHLSLHARW